MVFTIARSLQKTEQLLIICDYSSQAYLVFYSVTHFRVRVHKCVQLWRYLGLMCLCLQLHIIINIVERNGSDCNSEGSISDVSLFHVDPGPSGKPPASRTTINATVCIFTTASEAYWVWAGADCWWCSEQNGGTGRKANACSPFFNIEITTDSSHGCCQAHSRRKYYLHE